MGQIYRLCTRSGCRIFRYQYGSAGDSHPAEVEISPEHPKAELSFTLPPKPGFIRIHLRNGKTGEKISAVNVAVILMETPESPLLTMSCDSDLAIFVPPDTNLLLHVKSDGFREWDESVGQGKPLNLPSGKRMTLRIQLEALN